MSRTESPRWFLHPPTADEIGAFLQAQQAAAFSYAPRGASRAGTPAGYVVDHNRVCLGAGDADFAGACAALRDWKMFPAPWTRIEPGSAPLAEGQTVALLAQAFGIWWINGCRIVYTVDESAPARRFGFAYGTLTSHVEEGEELFCIEQRADGTVWYELRAFSRPRFWAVRLAAPLARRLQRRFAVQSKAAMKQAVAVARGKDFDGSSRDDRLDSRGA